MGNCLSSSKQSTKIEQIKDFYYLLRDKKYLLKISNKIISKHKIRNSIKIRKDSGVGYLDDGRIIIGGGTDRTGCLKNRVYIITPDDGKISKIENLPIASKEGAFFQYKDSVYYIGAIKDSDDEEILAQEQSASVMKYSLKTGSWIIYDDNRIQKEAVQESHNKNLKDNQANKKALEINYKEVLYAGMFMIKNKVFLVNGQRMKAEGVLETLTDVFSITLDEYFLTFNVEDFKFPTKIFRPICGSYYNKAFITGGIRTDIKSSNMESFLLTFSENGKISNIDKVLGLKLTIDDSYPMICSSSGFASIAYPNLAYYNIKEKSWLMFKFGEILIKKNTLNLPTPYLNLKKLQESLSQVYRHKDKIGENFSKSLSSVEHINIDLPPELKIQEKDFESLSPNSKSNDSNSSAEFSIERRIEFPEIREFEESKSLNSSLNYNEEFNKKCFPNKTKKKASVIFKQRQNNDYEKDGSGSLTSLRFLKSDDDKSYSSNSIISNASYDVQSVEKNFEDSGKKKKKRNRRSSSSEKYENKSSHEGKVQENNDRKKAVKKNIKVRNNHEASIESLKASTNN